MEQEVKRCERLSASTIGATLKKNIGAAMRPALIGEAVRTRRALRRSGALS